ncbi:MAG TPA: PQQ-binding-like beta-propeller repeat protein [Gaiellaceae bacterium]|jgi:outer membrane protein assembly factor BamB|nr:PQQ-binding-like beta-propeller repeat protein [Gaiellaceae bacterium]
MSPKQIGGIAGAVVAVFVPGFLAGIWLHEESTIDEKRGSPTVEFVTTQKAKAPNAPRPRRVVLRLPWPTYGLRVQRTHTSTDFKLRPPYRLRWTFKAGHVLEFPPSIAYGRLYVAQQRGRFFAFHHRTGKTIWQRRFNHCSAASPTVAYRVVYHSWMQPLPCNRYPRSQPGMITAMAARTGKLVWRYRAGVFESSPLVVGKTLYAGSWDRKLHAVNIYTGKARWTFTADHEINSSPAFANGKIYFGTDGGSLYALDARTGRLRWRARANSRFGRREYFYATPTIAYGRIFIGNTDGTMYAFGASSGRLLWAQNVGSYVYTAAAVWRQRVYVGTYDGYFLALDAATGDRLWRFAASSAIHGAPSVIDGLVYFAACPRCGRNASRSAKAGDRGTYALDARTGRLVWRWPDGVFSPAVADSQHLYIVGRSRIFSFAPKRRRAPAKQAKKRRAQRSKARSSRSSGRPARGREGRRSTRQSPPPRSTGGASATASTAATP